MCRVFGNMLRIFTAFTIYGHSWKLYRIIYDSVGMVAVECPQRHLLRNSLEFDVKNFYILFLSNVIVKAVKMQL